MDICWCNTKISRSFSGSDKRPRLTRVIIVAKSCDKMNQPNIIQPPGGMSAHFTRNINIEVVGPHILLKIPCYRVFTPYQALKGCSENVANHMFRQFVNLLVSLIPVSYTHLTLPTNREV